MTARNVAGLTEKVMDVLRQAYYETKDEPVQRLIVSALLAVNDLRLAVSPSAATLLFADNKTMSPKMQRTGISSAPGAVGGTAVSDVASDQMQATRDASQSLSAWSDALLR